MNIDFIGQGEGEGAVANHFMANGKLDPGVMRPYFDPKTGRSYMTVYTGGDPKKKESYKTLQANTTGTLRRDEWKLLDEALIPIAESRLQGTQDLITRGLVYNIGNGMGTTVLEHHDVSDALEADLTMDAVTRAQNDRPVFKTTYLPLPIVHADYEINTRALNVSRNMGNALDTTLAERAARRVAEKVEKMLFTNVNYAFGGGTIYSLVNYTNRNQVSIGTNWTSLSDNSSEGTVGEQIVAQVSSMKQTSLDNYHYGPWVLYVPSNYETLLDNDYNSYKTATIRERILKIANLQDIVVVDTLADNNVLLVQTTTDVVRIVRGMGLTNVQWTTEGGMVHKFKVMTIQVPQIRSDQNGKCGIVHLA